MIWSHDQYTLDDDRSRIEMARVVAGLRTTYWAKDRPAKVIELAWRNSVLVFGLYQDNELIGFARVISDLAIVAYLADVFIFPEHRGKGLGEWMCGTIVSHPDLATVRWLLNTRDMHDLYRKIGFTEPDNSVMMRMKNGQVSSVPNVDGSSTA